MSLCEQLTTQTRHDLDFSQERLKNCSDVLNNYFRCMLTSVPYLWGGTRAGGGERFASSTNNKASGCVFVVCVCSGEQTHFRPIIQSVLCLCEFHVFTDVKFSNRWILQPNSDQQGKTLEYESVPILFVWRERAVKGTFVLLNQTESDI